MTVLRTVELSADLITEVVARIREAGIEFTYDTGETTVVPMTGAVADDLSDRLREGFPLLSDDAGESLTAAPPARIVALEATQAPGRGAGTAHIADNVSEGPAATARTPVKKERAPRRTAASDGYADGDGFRGSAADPVHMYLKEIGKVKLLDAALEVELAERILAGNEAAARLAGIRRRERRDLPRSGGRSGAGAPGAVGQGGADRGQPPAGRLDCQAVSQPWPGLPRPNPGGQSRPDAGGGEVRSHQGLQVLHLRNLVDPSGDHPGHRRPGQDHPDPRAHGGDDQQGGVGPAPTPPGARPRAECRGSGRQGRLQYRAGPGDPADQSGHRVPRAADGRRGRFQPVRPDRGP